MRWNGAAAIAAMAGSSGTGVRPPSAVVATAPQRAASPDATHVRWSRPLVVMIATIALVVLLAVAVARSAGTPLFEWNEAKGSWMMPDPIRRAILAKTP